MVKVLQQNTWIDDRKFLKSCVQTRTEQGNINHPAYGTWTADFMLRQNESRAFLGKDLNDPRIPWIHKRREMMAIAGITPVAKWLAQIKQRSDVTCRLCKREREQCGASCRKRCMGTSTVPSTMEWWQPSRLPTTSSADICMPACKLHRHQRVSSSLSHLMKRVVWARCGRRKSLSRYVAENRSRKRQQKLEKTIAVKEHESEQHDVDPTIL